MPLLFARKLLACMSICVLPVSFCASAETPTEPLTLPNAIATAMARNPALAASSYELQIRDARIAQVSVRPNPELSLELEDFAGNGALSGVDSLQSILSLSQVVELGGKRGQRVSVARFGSDLSAIERQARELDLLAEVTKRFIDVVAAQEKLVLARSAGEIAERTVDALATRVQAARSPQAELSRAQIAMRRAQIDIRRAETELLAVRYALATLWGDIEPKFERVSADLYSLPTLLPLGALKERLTRTPDLVRFVTEARLRDAEWRLAIAQAKPNLTVSLGIRRFEATSDLALVAGISVPLPIADRNRGTIAEAGIRREQSQAEERAALVRIDAAVSSLYLRVQFNREQLATLRDEIVPQAQAALDQTQYGYERGRFSYVELAAAQQELLMLRGALIEAATDYHRLSAEIERLTGASLLQ